jgi:predicted nucleic-acid-binding protein
MIGLDTNLVLRLLLDDDVHQRRRIDALFAEKDAGPASFFVNDIVLAETVWTLSSAYGQPKSAIAKAVRALLAEPAYAFEDRAVVQQALDSFVSNRAGFADCLIVVKNTVAGNAFTATFDKALRTLPGALVV